MRQTSSLLTVVPDVNMLKDEIHNIVMDLPRGEQKFKAESGQIIHPKLTKFNRSYSDAIRPIPELNFFFN